MSNEWMAPGEHDMDLVAAYVENRLDAGERARMVTHLASCAECRAILATYARAAADSTDVSTPPAAAHAGLRHSGVWLSLAATVLAATAIILTVRSRDDGSAAPPSASVRSGSGAIEPDPGAGGSTGSSQRTVEGKTFRLVAGEWVDAAYDPLAALREVEARTADQRDALLQRVPALRPFAALGNRVIVVHDGTVYKFGADPLQ